MLKFIYTETGLFVEYLTQPLQEWMALRVKLASQFGEVLWTEDCTASFLLRADLVELSMLEAIDTIRVDRCDDEYIEVSLSGTWVASHPEQVEGVFVVKLSDRAETLLFKLWQASQTCASSIEK